MIVTPLDQVKHEPVKRPRGRPQLPPSEVVNTRMPLALIERMNRFVDNQRLWSDGLARNRAQLTRMAIDRFLAEKGY